MSYKVREIISTTLSNTEPTMKLLSIINTANYSGELGVIVIETNDVENVLKLYGFDCEECKEINKLNIGEKFDSHDYGNGCIVIRIA